MCVPRCTVCQGAPRCEDAQTLVADFLYARGQNPCTYLDHEVHHSLQPRPGQQFRPLQGKAAHAAALKQQACTQHQPHHGGMPPTSCGPQGERTGIFQHAPSARTTNDTAGVDLLSTSLAVRHDPALSRAPGDAHAATAAASRGRAVWVRCPQRAPWWRGHVCKNGWR